MSIYDTNRTIMPNGMTFCDMHIAVMEAYDTTSRDDIYDAVPESLMIDMTAYGNIKCVLKFVAIPGYRDGTLTIPEVGRVYRYIKIEGREFIYLDDAKYTSELIRD